MAIKKMYKINNSPATVLTVKAESSDTEFTVDDISAFPEAPNLAVVTDTVRTEIILYSGIEGSKLTGVTRGINGTVAQVWNIGTQIARTYTSYDHDTFIDNIEDLEDRKANTSDLGSIAYLDEINLSDTSISSSSLLYYYGGTKQYGTVPSDRKYYRYAILPSSASRYGYYYIPGSAPTKYQKPYGGDNGESSTYRLKDVHGYLDNTKNSYFTWNAGSSYHDPSYALTDLVGPLILRFRFNIKDVPLTDVTLFGAKDTSSGSNARFGLFIPAHSENDDQITKISAITDAATITFSVNIIPNLDTDILYDGRTTMTNIYLNQDGKIIKGTVTGTNTNSTHKTNPHYINGYHRVSPNEDGKGGNISYSMIKIFDIYGNLVRDLLPASYRREDGSFFNGLLDVVENKEYVTYY